MLQSFISADKKNGVRCTLSLSQAKWSILPEHVPFSIAWMSCQLIAGLPPALKFSTTCLYTRERSIARILVTCHTRERNTVTLAKAQTWTVQSGVQRTDH